MSPGFLTESLQFQAWTITKDMNSSHIEHSVIPEWHWRWSQWRPQSPWRVPGEQLIWAAQGLMLSWVLIHLLWNDQPRALGLPCCGCWLPPELDALPSVLSICLLSWNGSVVDNTSAGKVRRGGCVFSKAQHKLYSVFMPGISIFRISSPICQIV